MVEQFIAEFFAAITDKFFGFIGWFADPFWGWMWSLVCLYAAVILLCYFFGGWWPRLRAIGGALLLIATFGLYAYGKGERDGVEHYKRWRDR